MHAEQGSHDRERGSDEYRAAVAAAGPDDGQRSCRERGHPSRSADPDKVHVGVDVHFLATHEVEGGRRQGRKRCRERQQGRSGESVATHIVLIGSGKWKLYP
jgi:hypothetical protein